MLVFFFCSENPLQLLRIFFLVGMIIHGTMRNRLLKRSSTCYTKQNNKEGYWIA